MRVAAYLSGHAADAGGGYTFESDVFEALLAERGAAAHEISVIGRFPPDDELGRRVTDAGIAYRQLKERWHERWSLPLVRTVPAIRARWRRASPIDRAAAALDADLIWFVGAGAHLTDLPYVTVVWDVQHRVMPWFPELTGRGMWDSRELGNTWFLPRAAAIVAGTSAGADEIERYYGVNPDVIARLPHPTPQFALEAAARPKRVLPAGLAPPRPYLLYPAQFWAHKNHVNLLLALAHLRTELGLALDLVLVGSDKGNRAQVEQMVQQLGLQDAVHFPGFVSREELIALYQNAFALAYVSWFGPENLPPLEAFALSCPVVASRVSGAEEQLGTAALLANPGDPTDIAAQVAALHASADVRARLIAEGKVRAARWTARDYVRGVFGTIDRLEPAVRSWRPLHPAAH